MTPLMTVFTLGKEAISSPNNLSLLLIPCVPGKASPAEIRSEVFIESGQEYPTDIEWAAIIESDGSEEYCGTDNTPEKAVVALIDLLRGMLQTRHRVLGMLLSDAATPDPTE